jgi:putative flippase GtrA
MIRWWKFNAVGVAGVVVQLSALSLFANLWGIHYLPATALAVEIALLHNFVWHEAWTWRGLPPKDRWRRLRRFHVANGLVSILFNTLFTWCFKARLGLPLVPANVAAIAVTSVLNFALAHCWVFEGSETRRR